MEGDKSDRYTSAAKCPCCRWEDTIIRVVSSRAPACPCCGCPTVPGRIGLIDRVVGAMWRMLLHA